MRLEDCYKRRLLRRSRPDKGKAKRSYDLSCERMIKAEELKQNGFLEESIVASYSVMLMAARALLFKDDIVEKNHYCVILYLREKYVKEIGHGPISWLDTYRVERHQWFYGLNGLDVSTEESEDALERANDLIDRVSGLLEF